MHKTAHKCAAYWPRQNKFSTANYTDRLETAYCVWQHPEASPDGLNFVFVHGSQCCKEIFEYHSELLFAKFGAKLGKCVGIDVVTHGDSALLNHDKLGAYAAWDDIARDVGLVVRDALDPNPGPVFFMGHSMGGTVGLILGCLEPGLLAGIVALDPILYGPQFESIGPLLDGNYQLVQRALQVGRDSFESKQEFEEYYNTRFCRNWDPSVKKRFIPASATIQPNGKVLTKANLASQVSAYLSISSAINKTRSSFLDLSVPCLVIYGVPKGKKARFVPSHSAFLRDVVEDVRLVEFDGGHNFPFEQPQQTMEHVFPFVEDHSSTPKWSFGAKHDAEATKFQFDQLDALLAERKNVIQKHYKDVKLARNKL